MVTEKDNQLFLSIAGLWEISIKYATGKLEIKGGYDSIEDDLERNKIDLLPISL